MKDQRKTEIKVGITVLIAIIIFLFVFGWAKNITFNSNRKILIIDFNSVAGLEIGDPATINGVRKGYVDNIKVKGSVVEVFINMNPDVTIYDDARFYIMMLDLMGGKKIEINPGNSLIEIDYGIKHKGELLGDIASAMAVLGSVQTDLIEVIKEVKISLVSVNSHLTNPKFNEDLSSSIENLSLLTANLNSLIAENRKEINKLLNKSTELTKSVNDFIDTNKDSLQLTISSMRQTLKSSQLILNKMNTLIEQTDKSENNLGKMLNDPIFWDDLKTSMNQLKELTKLLYEQLKAKGIKVDAKINLF